MHNPLRLDIGAARFDGFKSAAELERTDESRRRMPLRANTYTPES
jgi:hypothetical protein